MKRQRRFTPTLTLPANARHARFGGLTADQIELAFKIAFNVATTGKEVARLRVMAERQVRLLRAGEFLDGQATQHFYGGPVDSAERQHAVADATEAFFNCWYNEVMAIGSLLALFPHRPTGTSFSTNSAEKLLKSIAAVWPELTEEVRTLEAAREYRAADTHVGSKKNTEWITTVGSRYQLRIAWLVAGAPPEGKSAIRVVDGTSWMRPAPDYNQIVIATAALVESVIAYMTAEKQRSAQVVGEGSF